MKLGRYYRDCRKEDSKVDAEGNEVEEQVDLAKGRKRRRFWSSRLAVCLLSEPDRTFFALQYIY